VSRHTQPPIEVLVAILSHHLCLLKNMSKIPQPPDLGGTSDLMSRLGNFLPQMAAANQDLESMLTATEDGSNPLQIDAVLQKDDNDSDAASDCSDDDMVDGKQTIHMTVALGNLDSNPIMSLLTNDGQEENNAAESDESDDDESDDGKPNDINKVALALLGKGKDVDVGAQGPGGGNDNDAPLFTVRSTRRKDGASS